MPLLRIFTNVPKNEIPKDFVDRATPVLSEAIGKPVEKIICFISGDTPVAFAGDSQGLGAVADIASIGKLGPDENKRIADAVSRFVERELGVPPHRFMILFNNFEAWDIAIRGSTVYEQGLV